jgi:putative polyhydroxyalkanoate system protein
MADIEIQRVHDLGLKAARAAADRMAEHLGRKFDLKGDWEGNVLKFQRPGVSGSLSVSDKDVRLSVALGFLLKAMKGSIENAIVHELDALFAAKSTPASTKPAKPVGKRAPAPPKKDG